MFRPYTKGQKLHALRVAISRLRLLTGEDAAAAVAILESHVLGSSSESSELIPALGAFSRDRRVMLALAPFVMCSLNLRGGGEPYR
jgi:hypothetical protein